MTHDELAELDRLTCFEPGKSYDYLMQLCEASPSCSLGSGDKRFYQPPRMGQGPNSVDERFHQELSILLVYAGMADAVRALRDSSPGGDFPTERDLSSVETLSREFVSNPQPDAQVLACLRLLECSSWDGKTHARLQALDWLTPLAEARLNKLIVTHPALLHPFIQWRHALPTGGNHGWQPLAHAFLGDGRGTYNDPHGLVRLAPDVSEEELRDFALHPAVATAMLTPTPTHGDSSLGGVTVLDTLGRTADVNVPYATSLMLIERVRREWAAPAIFADDHHSYNLDLYVARAFGKTLSEEEESPHTQAFLHELKHYVKHRGYPAFMCILDQSTLVVAEEDPFTDLNGWVPGFRERLHKMVSMLVDAGAGADKALLARSIMRHIFHEECHTPAVKFGALTMPTDMAITFIKELQTLGVTLDEAADALDRASIPYPNARAALDVVRAAAEMSDRIKASQGAQHATNVAPAPRRIAL